MPSSLKPGKGFKPRETPLRRGAGLRSTPFKRERAEPMKRTYSSRLGTARQRPDGTRALGKECDRQTSLAVRHQTPCCVLCGESRWGSLTCGHMFKRGVQSVRYDYLPGGNNSTLCFGCNGRDNEDHGPYERWFKRTYGAKAYEALKERAKTPRKWEPDELRVMIAERASKVKELRDERRLEAA